MNRAQRVIIVAVLGLIGLIGLTSCSKSEADKQADTRRQSPKPQTNPIPGSPEMQAQRKAFIEKLMVEGLFTAVDQPADLPHVWVTPAFRALDYQAQDKFISVVFAYYYAGTSGPKDPLLDWNRILVLKDSQTGKRIGTYSRANAGLKYE